MKKCLLFGILVILLSFVVVLGESCTDSDGGKNYYVKGKVIADVILGSGLAEDTCVSEIKLREMFCNENGEGEPYLYTCPNGCEDGACIIEEICENECGYIGEKICGIHHISLGGLVMTCGNYDDDECLEWQGKYCGEGYKCFDGQCIPECTDECGYIGEKICGIHHISLGGLVMTCGNYDDDECLEWDYEYCGKDNECVDGECQCTDECGYIGEKICGIHHISLGGQVLTCGNYDDDECLEWDYEYCGEGYKCVDGKCVFQTQCTDECDYIGEKICGIHHISLGGLVMTCGNYDDDECLEWQGKYCGEGYKCVDGQCIVCHGCLLENECLPYGIRMESNNVPSYCDIDKTIKPQKEMEETCQNDYECKTNDCSDGRCVSTYNLLERIWDLLKRIFRF